MSSPRSETRTRILSTTLLLLVKQRGKGVRVSDIALAAGITRQGVYLHFPNRTDLLVATVRYADELYGLEDRLKPFRTAPAGVETLHGYIAFWGNYLPLIYGLARALLDMRNQDKAAAAAWDDRMQALRVGCVNVFDCLRQAGILRPEMDSDQGVDLLWSLLGVGIWEDLTITRGWSNAQYIKAIQELARRTFVN